jgi:hypothetical protein
MKQHDQQENEKEEKKNVRFDQPINICGQDRSWTNLS